MSLLLLGLSRNQLALFLMQLRYHLDFTYFRANLLQQCSKTTLFKVAKTIGTSTNSLVQTAGAFSSIYPSADPNFQLHLTQSVQVLQLFDIDFSTDDVQAIQSSGLQLLTISKVVIQEEFKNQRYLQLVMR